MTLTKIKSLKEKTKYGHKENILFLSESNHHGRGLIDVIGEYGKVNGKNYSKWWAYVPGYNSKFVNVIYKSKEQVIRLLKKDYGGKDY